MIPIIIVSYNNYLYVDNTINQIKNINPDYLKNIIIMDNNSNDPETINYLNNNNSSVSIIRNKSNAGPWVNKGTNAHIFEMMPEKYILTDPDLEFNKNIPTNFIEIMNDLSNKYGCAKIGFALKIDDFQEDMFKGDNYHSGLNIYDFERKFWYYKINDDKYELFLGAIDTTVCLINKKLLHDPHFSETSIRIAGNFTARHLPWYKTKDIFNLYEKYNLFKKTTEISTISKLVLPYIENNYTKVYKNGHTFLIENSNKHALFWRDVYSSWNIEHFRIYDSLSSKNKDILDIGYNIGLTSTYLGRISRNVKSINLNSNNLEKTIVKNIITDNCSNVTIYDGDFGEDITFEGLNNFLINNNINNYNEFSFININLNGFEENMMQDLYEFQKKISIPILINIQFTRWKDQSFSRFSFLEENIKIVDDYPLILS